MPTIAPPAAPDQAPDQLRRLIARNRELESRLGDLQAAIARIRVEFEIDTAACLQGLHRSGSPRSSRDDA